MFSLEESFNLIKHIIMSQNIQEKYRGRMIRIINEKVVVGGKEKVFEFAERLPGVRFLITSGNKILLNFEKRVETKGGIDYRLPGGKVIDKIEDYISFMENSGDIELEAKKAAKKELEEEAHISLNLEDLALLHKSHAGSSIKWGSILF